MTAPDQPTDLGGRGWWGALKRTVNEFQEDNLTDWAAALTYYGVLAIFPALIVLVSILGLVGESATQPLIDNLGAVAPGSGARRSSPTRSRTSRAARARRASCSSSGLLGALWSASGYVGAFMRASNAIYDMPEGRPVWKTLPVRVGADADTAVPARDHAHWRSCSPAAWRRRWATSSALGNTAVDVWDIAKWPVLLLVVSFMFALLYWAAPERQAAGIPLGHPRAASLAVVGWLIASAAFAFYVANFGSYNKTYGALGGVIVFLVWLWISNIVILLGAEFNAELERGRAIEGGMRPDDREPFAEPRDTRKMDPEQKPA